MKNVEIFNSISEITDYIKLNAIQELGSGVEGVVYLTKSNKAIKYIQNSLNTIAYRSDIIMSNDYNLSSFIFPDKLLMYKNLVYGYESKYFKNDVLCNEYRKEKVEIDLEKLLEARERLIEDVKVLTNEKYKLDDIPGNVLFDGNNLACIDTLSYNRNAFVTLNNNILAIDRALDFKLYVIDRKTADWNLSFENKVKKLIIENKTSKILIKPLY